MAALFRSAASAQEMTEGDQRVAMTHIDRGLSALASGKLMYAKPEFEFVLRLRGASYLKGVAYLNLGVVSFMEGNLEQAKRNYNLAIQNTPDYAEAHFNLGTVYYKQKNLKEAEKAFLKAIELEPKYGRAHYSLGFVYLDQRKFDLARQEADLAEKYGVPYTALKERLPK